MRNFAAIVAGPITGGVLSIEKFQHVSSENYSAEEAELEMSEAQDAAEEVQAIQADLSQAQEVAGSLEDIEGLITEGEPLTEREANLVAVAGDLAYAGTEPGDVEPIVPEAAMESYRTGGRISFENRFTDAIKNFWRYIKQIVAKAWKKMKEFYAKYFGPVKKLEKTFEALKKEASALAGSAKIRDNERNFDLTSGVSTLCIDYKALTSGAEVLKHGQQFTQLLRSALSADAANKARAFLEGVNGIVSGFEPDSANAAATVAQVASVFQSLVKGRLAWGFTKTTLANSGDYEFYTSPTVFGNRSVFIRVHRNAMAANATAQTAADLAALNKTSISFRETIENTSKEKPTECSFSILTPTQMEDLCDQAIEWTRILQAHSGGRAFADLEKERTRLEKSTDSLEARFVKYEGRSNASSTGATGVSVALYRQFVSLNSVALNVAAGTTLPLEKHALGVMGAYRHIIKASMSHYE